MKKKKIPAPLQWSWKVTAFAFRFLVAIPFSAVVGDTPSRVHKNEPGWNRASAWAGLLLIVTVLPWLAFSAFRSSGAPVPGALLLVLLVGGAFWLPRRFSADRGVPLRLGEFVRAFAAFIHQPTAEKGVEPEPLPWRNRAALLAAQVAAFSMVVAVIAGLLLAVPATAPAAAPIADVLSWYPAVFVAGYWALLGVGAAVAIDHTRGNAEAKNVKLVWTQRIALILGTTPREFEEGGGKFAFSEGDGVLTIALSIKSAGIKESEVEQRLTRSAPGWAVRSLNFDELILESVELNREAAARRAHAETSGGIIVGKRIDPTRNDRALLDINPAMRVSVAQIDHLARQMGAGVTVVAYDEVAHVATLEQLNPVTLQMRSAVARLIGCDAHRVELVVDSARVDPGSEFVRELRIVRSPVTSRDAAKRREFWMEHVAPSIATPSGYRWTYTEDVLGGTASLRSAPDPLGVLVAFDQDMTTTASPHEPWQVGVDENGAPVSIDLASSAHLLIAGATRSGKSVCTYGLLAHVARMGDCARLLVADPNDTTLAAFENVVSYGTADTSPTAPTEMLRWVRAEMDRRKPILREMRADKLEVFSPATPLVVVVIDEAANYLRNPDKTAAAEFADELLAVVSQGAKYGIRVCLITQRPDNTILNTATRAQLSARISFRLEDKETAGMVFPDISNPSELLTYDPGVGLIREVGGQPRRFRSAYLQDHWGAAAQITSPVPRVDISDRRPQAARVTTPPAAVVTLDPLEFTLTDLEPEFTFTA